MFGDNLIVADDADFVSADAERDDFASVFSGRAVTVVIGTNQAGAGDADAGFDIAIERRTGSS